MTTSARDLTADLHSASAHVLARATHLAAPVSCLQCVTFPKGGEHVVVSAGGSVIRSMRLREVAEIAESCGAEGVERQGWEWAQGRAGEKGAEAFPAVASAPAKGMEAIADYLAALQSCTEGRYESRGNDASPDPSGLTISKLMLQTGQVTSLAVCALPEGISALGVAGTTQGTLCVFLMEGGALSLLNERSLGPCSEGRISADDAVKDVAISMDPAGRPEFVVAATDRCMVLLDVLDIVEGSKSPHGSGEKSASEGCGTETRATDPTPRAQAPFSAGSLWRWPSTIQRDRSEPLCVTFANTASASHLGAPSSLSGDEVGEIVRVLVPQRAHAAFAVDVAVVVVLADSTVRYIERRVCGGSVRLLLEYHQALQNAASRSSVMVNELLGETARFTGSHSPNTTPQTTLPHVKFEYRLSLQSFNACQCADGSAVVALGGKWIRPGSRHDLSVTVNDASLFFNVNLGRMDLILVGCRHATHAPYTIPDGEVSGGGLARSPLTAAAEPARGVGRVGWWAVARAVVLPRRTLHPYTASPPALRGGGRGLDRARPTVRVQSATMAADAYHGLASPTRRTGQAPPFGAPAAMLRGRLSQSPEAGVEALAKVRLLHRRGEVAAVLVGGSGLLLVPALPPADDVLNDSGDGYGREEEERGRGALSALPPAPRLLCLGGAVVEDIAVVAEADGHPACVLCAVGSTLTFLSI